MAIRVEFFAENQMIASSVVEFALSRGAILQSYSEINPPLKHKPKAPQTTKRKKSKRVSTNRFVQCVNSDLPFKNGTAQYEAGRIIVQYNEPTSVKEIYTAVKKAGINMRMAYAAMRILFDMGHVIVVS